MSDDFDDEIAPEGNRILGGRARAVVEHLTRSIAEDPDAVEVTIEEQGDDAVMLWVHAASDDMGRLIGKRGRVIQAVRQVTRAAGVAEGVTAGVDVAE